MLFEPWVGLHWLRHGFSSRETGDFRDRNSDQAAALLGETEPLVTVRQTHSATVWRVERALEAVPERLEGDALLSDRAGRLAAVRTADCGPILLLDRKRRAVAAVHAGWRGAAQRIVERAVLAMVCEYGCEPQGLEAVVGPCIGPTRYEVGEEVAERFETDVIRRPEGAPRPFLDLPEANRRQLLACGLSAENVAVAGLCTFEDERFYSHRREGARAGRMAAMIGLAG